VLYWEWSISAVVAIMLLESQEEVKSTVSCEGGLAGKGSVAASGTSATRSTNVASEATTGLVQDGPIDIPEVQNLQQATEDKGEEETRDEVEVINAVASQENAVKPLLLIPTSSRDRSISSQRSVPVLASKASADKSIASQRSVPVLAAKASADKSIASQRSVPVLAAKASADKSIASQRSVPVLAAKASVERSISSDADIQGLIAYLSGESASTASDVKSLLNALRNIRNNMQEDSSFLLRLERTISQKRVQGSHVEEQDLVYDKNREMGQSKLNADQTAVAENSRSVAVPDATSIPLSSNPSSFTYTSSTDSGIEKASYNFNASALERLKRITNLLTAKKSEIMAPETSMEASPKSCAGNSTASRTKMDKSTLEPTLPSSSVDHRIKSHVSHESVKSQISMQFSGDKNDQQMIAQFPPAVTLSKSSAHLCTTSSRSARLATVGSLVQEASVQGVSCGSTTSEYAEHRIINMQPSPDATPAVSVFSANKHQVGTSKEEYNLKSSNGSREAEETLSCTSCGIQEALESERMAYNTLHTMKATEAKDGGDSNTDIEQDVSVEVQAWDCDYTEALKITSLGTVFAKEDDKNEGEDANDVEGPDQLVQEELEMAASETNQSVANVKRRKWRIWSKARKMFPIRYFVRKTSHSSDSNEPKDGDKDNANDEDKDDSNNNNKTAHGGKSLEKEEDDRRESTCAANETLHDVGMTLAEMTDVASVVKVLSDMLSEYHSGSNSNSFQDSECINNSLSSPCYTDKDFPDESKDEENIEVAKLTEATLRDIIAVSVQNERRNEGEEYNHNTNSRQQNNEGVNNTTEDEKASDGKDDGDKDRRRRSRRSRSSRSSNTANNRTISSKTDSRGMEKGSKEMAEEENESSLFDQLCVSNVGNFLNANVTDTKDDNAEPETKKSQEGEQGDRAGVITDKSSDQETSGMNGHKAACDDLLCSSFTVPGCFAIDTSFFTKR
jgi:hypothetical protein